MKARIIKINYCNGSECFKIQFQPCKLINLWFTEKFIKMPDGSKVKNRFNMLENSKPYLQFYTGNKPIKTVVYPS